MHAPVGGQSPCIIPEETEVIMEPVLIEIAFRCRPQPHIIIHTRGRCTIGHYRQCPFACLISPHLDGTHVSQLTTLHVCSGFVPVGIAALPLSHLHDTVVLARCFHHQVT